ncbi:MAG: pentapeptide repeat-containing protein [Nostoc sp. DedQUE04]|uniref:pentapeptide repeat-containing protein n=1 Tax=Nostoc sp. DedQUE04 TaxID=3075390 RepID=UPI002AD249F8|nr:pentapeptide repeat-containing protein [Nostoc sp. DedQUE04]MDZ8139693.1 pentapeptide repeat-containing protein [Nostoc sp. DedQUE04]
MPYDFSNQNLRGRSFKGQNLEGANFSGANIRGADFSSANLTRANFSNAKAGLKLIWIFFLLILSLAISSLSGFTSAIILNFNIYFWLSKKLPAVVVICYSIFISLIRGILNNFLDPNIVVIINIYLPVGAILAVAYFGATAAVDEPKAKLGGVAVTNFVVMAILTVLVFSQMGELAQQTLINTTQAKDIQIIKVFAEGKWLGRLVGGFFGGFWGYFFSQAAIEGDPKFSWIWKMCINFAARGGTSFYQANLTGANFTKALLKGADFKSAVLICTLWRGAKYLGLARLKKTYLQKPQIRELVVSGNGENKIFDIDVLNLEGINLSGANLSDASFIGVNLNYANLSRTNLSRIKLKQTQLDGANFTSAILTGACIEDWHINSTTTLDDVICDYIYLRQNQQERCPSSGNFAPGEFTQLFQKSLETVDLIFHNGIDWDAFAYSFKKLEVENQGAQLDVQSIEKKGDGILVVRVAVSSNADKAKIHSDFIQGYEFAARALEAQYQARLEDKDTLISKQETQINRLFDIVEQQGSVQKALAENPRKVSNYNMQNPQFASGIVDANTVDADQIGGNIHNKDA